MSAHEPLFLTPRAAVEWTEARLARRGPCDLLDAGCGTGAWAARARAAGHRVRAADLDPTACQVPDLAVERADLSERWPWPDATFDAVTSFEVFEHLENPFRAAREAARVLRPGGELLLSVPNGGMLRNRLKFLLTGSGHRPYDSGPRPASGPDSDGLRHRQCWTAPALAAVLEDAGLRLEDARAAGFRLDRLPLVPLAALVRLATLVWPRRHRARYRLPLANAWDQLLCGGSILLAAGRA